MKRLQDKVAVVTGGAFGIGEAIVQAFVAEGALVVIADLGDRGHDTAARLGSSAIGFSADVSSSADVRAMLDHAVSTFGRLDIVCNNAGLGGELAPIADYDDAEFDRVLAVNLRGTFLGIKHAIPHLKERGGAIVNTASIAGSVVMPNMPAYCAAKAGVMQLTKVPRSNARRSASRSTRSAPGLSGRQWLPPCRRTSSVDSNRLPPWAASPTPTN